MDQKRRVPNSQASKPIDGISAGYSVASTSLFFTFCPGPSFRSLNMFEIGGLTGDRITHVADLVGRKTYISSTPRRYPGK